MNDRKKAILSLNYKTGSRHRAAAWPNLPRKYQTRSAVTLDAQKAISADLRIEQSHQHHLKGQSGEMQLENVLNESKPKSLKTLPS
jgi:hypothetical protein